ncbi:MAG: hypothetical protein FJX77_17805, partial [Armatimonadetes bacterium]|nr:hypothetical protein [Armatimonadota bacterium]
MSPSWEPITSLLTAALASVPLGTNLGLFRGATVCLSGRLLASRGALLPALDDFGLSPAECRQVLSALSHGCWRWEPLLAATEAHIRARPDWQPTQWDGYEPVAVDLTAFPRPRLQGLETSHYDAIARRNLPSVVLGLAVAVGQIRSQPVPVLRVVQERDPADPREAALVQLLLARVAKTLQPTQVAVFDAGF